MPESSVKQDARRLVERLGDDATWEDLQYEIDLCQAVEAGLKDVREGRTVPLEEARNLNMTIKDVYGFARTGDVVSLREFATQGGDLNAKDSSGLSALHYAIAHKQVETIDELLRLGVAVAIQDSNGLTALHYAIEHGLPNVLEALLRKCPEAISISDRHGNQPLWTAAFNARGDYKMVTVLLEHGADPEHPNKVSLTPIDIAKRKGETALLELLNAKVVRKPE